MMNISTIGQTMPRNLPRMNCRRPTGFDSTVSAVRPSISSATDVLAVHRAMMMARTLIVVMPEVLSIFTSSPNVLYGMKTKATSTTTPMRGEQHEHRLRDRFLGRGGGDDRGPRGEEADRQVDEVQRDDARGGDRNGADLRHLDVGAKSQRHLGGRVAFVGDVERLDVALEARAASELPGDQR